MDTKFNSVEELYKRVYPALTAKKNELHRLGYNYIKQKDIWDYLRDSKWKNSKGLTLSEMVDNILNCENKKIDHYVKEQLRNKVGETHED